MASFHRGSCCSPHPLSSSLRSGFLAPIPASLHLLPRSSNRKLVSGRKFSGTILCKSYQIDAEDKHTTLLKKKASEVVDDLKGTCIYLVGMMGSGKTTVGKSLAEALGYHFFDSDNLIKEALGDGRTVSQLMEEERDSFRDVETEVLKQLSCIGRSVVATGGDTVLRPTNWGYIRHGVTVWLDVPVEALAQRAADITSYSKSFLEVVDIVSDEKQALEGLSSVLNDRKRYYADADTSVSLMKMMSENGHTTLQTITPEMVALQVLEEICKLMKQRK